RRLAAFDRRSLGHRSGFPLPVIVLGVIIRQARAFVKRIFRSMRRKCGSLLANFTNFCYNNGNGGKYMKLVSWNVNGLRPRLEKGFAESAAALDADVICLQEIKMSPEHYMEVLPGYEALFNSAEKKGYSGTGVLSRVPMLSHTFGIGVDEHDHE